VADVVGSNILPVYLVKKNSGLGLDEALGKVSNGVLEKGK